MIRFRISFSILLLAVFFRGIADCPGQEMKRGNAEDAFHRRDYGMALELYSRLRDEARDGRRDEDWSLFATRR